MSLRYLVKFDMLIAHVLPLSSYTSNYGIYANSTVCSKFASSVGNSVWEILQEMMYNLQNMHHFPEAIDGATDEWLPQ